MFDNTPLEQEEIIDQCRALIYAVIETKQPQVKEILTFILWKDSTGCIGIFMQKKMLEHEQ